MGSQIKPVWLLATIAVFATFPNQGAAQTGRSYESLSGTGCLDVDMGAPRGSNGAGRNVIVWPQCHGGSNQLWKRSKGGYKTTINGQDYCLDVHYGERTGSNGDGFNIIAWPDCHGGNNQRFKMRKGRIMIGRKTGRCLDVNRQDGVGSRSLGRNVIAWGCTDGSNQQWRKK